METMTCSTNLAPEKIAMQSTKRRRVIVAVAVVVSAVVWYLFRPELLFINKNVNEGFPVAGDNAMTGASTGRGRRAAGAAGSGPGGRAAGDTRRAGSG